MFFLILILVVLGIVTPYLFYYNSLYAMDKLRVTFSCFPKIKLTEPNSYLVYIGYLGTILFLGMYLGFRKEVYLFLSIYFLSLIIGTFISFALLKK